VELVILGSGTTYPDAERGPAGLWLRAAGRSWLIDGGSGTLQRCARAGGDPLTFCGGVFSHRHADHTGDLVPWLFTHRVAGRTEPWPIWAGRGFQAFFDKLTGVYGDWIRPAGGVPITELSLEGADAADLGGVRLLTRPANHSAGALHLRFEADGAAIVFSGDTGPSDALAELATGADLLVTECAGSDEAPIEGHLSPTDIRRIAEQARPKEIWLTHLYPGVSSPVAVATVAASGIPTRHAADFDRWSTP